MGKNCKIYKRICLNLALCVGLAWGENIADFSLPSSINLSANQQREDVAISSKGNGTMTTFYNVNSAGNLSINGAANSKYTLKVNDNTTTFFAGSLSVQGSAELSHFHTVNFNANVSVGANSNFTIINSGNSINAQYSEFGGRSKIRFGNRNAQVIFGKNSSTLFSYTLFFINDAQMTLNSASKLDIISQNGARFQNTFTNNGGTATFGGDVSGTMINTNVYNIGSVVGTHPNQQNTVAVFTQNSGEIVINGDFYNGGQAVVDSSGALIDSFDPAFGGGGDLILNGGTMKITGKLVSKRGGTEAYGGELIDAKNSTIKLYGATLIVGGGLSNLQGSTLIFGIGNNDKMGLLQGNLSQNSGSVKLDINKMRANTKYTIISGSTPSGFGAANITLIGSNADLWNLSYENGVVSISTSGGNQGSGGESGGGNSGGSGESGGGNSGENSGNTSTPSKFELYKASLNANEKALLNAMSAAFGGDEVLLSEIEDLKSAVTETEQTLKNSYIAQPKRMINAFKSDLLHAPMRVSVASRRLAASGFVRLDSGKRVSPFVVKSKRDFFISPMVSAFEDDGVDGNLYGFTLGASWASEKALNRVHFSYALGKSTQNLSTQSTDTRANLFELGAINRYKMGFWESEIAANAVFGGFEVDNFWHQQTLNSSSKFNNYQANLGVNLGPRLGEKLSFKPFLGLSNYFEHQDAFKMGFGLSADCYNAYILDAVLGFETHYIFSEFASVFARVGFEKRLYNSHKLAFIRSDLGEMTYENESYDNVLSVNLGTQLLSYNALNVDVEGFFKRYDTALIHYGGNLVLRWRF